MENTYDRQSLELLSYVKHRMQTLAVCGVQWDQTCTWRCPWGFMRACTYDDAACVGKCYILLIVCGVVPNVENE